MLMFREVRGLLPGVLSVAGAFLIQVFESGFTNFLFIFITTLLNELVCTFTHSFTLLVITPSLITFFLFGL